jgi:hypothetical protein
MGTGNVGIDLQIPTATKSKTSTTCLDLILMEAGKLWITGPNEFKSRAIAMNCTTLSVVVHWKCFSQSEPGSETFKLECEGKFICLRLNTVL